MKLYVVFIACAWAAFVSGVTAGQSAQPNTHPAGSRANANVESWQVLMVQGQRIGYAHSTSHEEMRDGKRVQVTDGITRMSLTRLGQKLSMSQTMHVEEDAQGHLLKFNSRLENPPSSTVVTTGLVRENIIDFVTSSGGKETPRTLTHTGPILSPGYPERFLQEQGLEVGASASFEVFEAEVGQIIKVTLKRTEDRKTRIWGGAEETLKHYAMTQSFLPGLTTSLYADNTGEVVKMVAPLVGMEFYTVDEATALQELEGEPLDIAVGSLIALDTPRDPHTAKRAVYRIRVDGGNPVDLFASGLTQSIRVIDDDEVFLQVQSLRPGSNSEADTTPVVTNLSEFMAKTRFAQWDDPLLLQLAEQGAGDQSSADQIALSLEKFVRSTITSKNFSTAMATALEVAQTRSGDCTEHSVLLAALLRAKQIPSRVAIGFVYSPSHKALVGHMWTEALLDGNWMPLDGTMGRGGIGVGHLKVADSSLADEGTFPISGFVPLIHLLGRTTVKVESIE